MALKHRADITRSPKKRVISVNTKKGPMSYRSNKKFPVCKKNTLKTEAQPVSKDIRIPGVMVIMIMMMMIHNYNGEFFHCCFDFELNSTHNE